MRHVLQKAAFGWACAAAIVGTAAGEPQPSPAPVTWELTFKPSNLQRIRVAVAGASEAKTYWYLLYRVVNDTGQDVDFLPTIERVSDILTETPADQAAANPSAASRMIVEPAIVGLHPAVFRAIKERHATTYPMLVEPVYVIGRILQGIDNARESVAVFNELDPRVNRFTVYVGGLSGERKSVPNPVYDPRLAKASGGKGPEAAKNVREFVLQKTLAMRFTLPGDAETRRSAAPQAGRLEWVMR